MEQRKKEEMRKMERGGEKRKKENAWGEKWKTECLRIERRRKAGTEREGKG